MLKKLHNFFLILKKLHNFFNIFNIWIPPYSFRRLAYLKRRIKERTKNKRQTNLICANGVCYCCRGETLSNGFFAAISFHRSPVLRTRDVHVVRVVVVVDGLRPLCLLPGGSSAFLKTGIRPWPPGEGFTLWRHTRAASRASASTSRYIGHRQVDT